jgi:hypothetical protein
MFPLHHNHFWGRGVVTSLALAASILICRPATAEVDVAVVQDVGDRIELSFDIGPAEATDVRIGRRFFTEYVIPSEGVFKTVGAPALPRVARSVIIPDDQHMSLRVVNGVYEEHHNVFIAPSKGYITRDVDPATVPYTFGREYKTDAFFPGALAQLGDPYIMRDFRGVSVAVHPYQYNPVKRVLRIYSQMTVELVADGPGLVNVLKRGGRAVELTQTFNDIYGTHFVNHTHNNRYDPINEEGGMLIICHDAFLANIQPFADHKNGIGISTEVVAVSTIGNTAAQIQAAINDAYTTDGISFVLLVGDDAQVKAVRNGSYGADPMYGLITGSDNFPEVIIGRFSAETAAQVDTQVQRSINHETAPAVEQDWYWKGIGLGSTQGTGDDGQYDDEHLDEIRTWLIGFGYTHVDQLYGTVSDSTVSAALNEGRGIVNYCGHGWLEGWSTSGFDNTDANNLTNTGKLPFIISVACQNGQFTSATCFCEAFLRATHNGQPAGAVAMCGSSPNQAWSPPMEMQDEFNLLLTNLAEPYHSYGGLYAAGGSSMMEDYPGDPYSSGNGVYTYNTWVLFGDPSLRVIGTTMPFTMNCTNTDAVVCSPDDAVYEIAIDKVGEFSDAVTLSVDNLPAGAVANFDANPVYPPATVNLTISGTASVTPGAYELQLAASAPPDLQISTDLGLNVSTMGPADMVLEGPADMAVEVAIQPVLSWYASAQAATYYVEFDDDAGFASPLYAATVTGLDFPIPDRLDPMTEYFWRVRAENACGVTPFSDTWSFTTMDLPCYFTEMIESGVDVEGLTARFIPDGSGDHYSVCVDPATELPTDPTGGTTVAAGDDYTSLVNTGGTPFPFYGTDYNSFYVCSNGFITFGADINDWSETVDEHFDYARIAALWDDLNPTVHGQISYRILADRIAVTWDGVAEYSTSNYNTFQAELFFDGEINITWIDVDLDDCLIGLSNGGGTPVDWPDSAFMDVSSEDACEVIDPCPWDISGDGAVGLGDLNALLSNWGAPCPGAGCPFDYDVSGGVGLGDLNALLSNWGPCP